MPLTPIIGLFVSPLTDDELRASAVPVSGPLTDAQLAARLPLAVLIDEVSVPASAPLVGQKAIAVTGTALALAAVATPLPTSSVLVAALSTNTAAMTVGGSAVTNVITGAGNGFIIEAGQSVVIMADDLADVFINGTAGDVATFSAG